VQRFLSWRRLGDWARAGGLALFVLLSLALRAEGVHADDGPAPATPSGLEAGLEQQVRALAAAGGNNAPPTGVTRVEVAVGQLDTRLRLAPCQRVEPYLPNNARLWGKTRIGLRCAQGPSHWNVYLPVTVKAFGRGLVATAGIASGSVLKAENLIESEVDLAEDSMPVLVDADRAIGRPLTQSLRPGQSLRAGHLKPRIWFAAGDTVKVLALGPGFALEAEGQALSNGVEGQPARIRTENGRVLTGQPVGERRVELTM
jgi:flagella basal body P-ring formation protein FlgA